MASTRITRTPGSAGNRNKWTMSMWLKRSGMGSTNRIFSVYQNSNYSTEAYFNGGSAFVFFDYYNGSYNGRMITNRLFLDPSAWYHIVINWDKDNGTGADKLILWVNGVRDTNLATDTQPSNASTWNVDGQLHEIGAYNNGDFYNGCMSHIQFVDGLSLAPTEFGETDATTGEWKIKTASYGTPGTNGFHLKMEDSSNMDLDSSSNTLTFATAGTLTATQDNPSNVFATINPLYRMDLSNNATLSNGNTTFSSDQSGYNIRYGTLGASKGKFYYECKFISQTNHGNSDSFGMPFGISGSQIPSGQQGGGYAQYDYSYNYNGSDGTVQNNNTTTNYGATVLDTVGQIGMCAFDLDNNKVYFGVNGVWTNSGNPAGNANGFTIADPDDTELGIYFPSTADRSSNRSYVYSFNFGNGYFGTTAVSSAGTNASGIGIFEYDVPTGYTALSTKGLNE